MTEYQLWQYEQFDNWYVVELVDNHIDFRNVDQLKKCIQGWAGEGRSQVVMNLSNVSFVDSSGLGAILYCKKTLEAAGGRLVLTNLQTYVQNLVKLTHLNKAITIYDNRDQALQELVGQSV